MDATYAARYRRLYEQHWWWRAREDYLVAWLRVLRPVRAPCSILDVGCGDGLFFERLREFGEPEGVEVDASLVSDEGRRRGAIHLAPFDASFRPGKRYDLVLLLDVLEHVADDEGFLRRAVELLEPGRGRAVATVPAFRVLWTGHDELNHHRARYTKRTFGELAGRAGLRIEGWRYFDHWMFPAKLLVRLKESLLPAPARVPDVPAPWLNRALYRLTRLEHAALGRLPIPFGSSLLVWGRPASLR